MTKIIGVLIVVALIWGGYEIFTIWDKYNHDQDIAQQEAAAKEAALHIPPEQLGGMPEGLEKTYQIAVKRGAVGIRDWLRAYGAKVQDPRRAWIELDYVVAVSHDDPVEAKKVFAEVKARTPENSQVYPRIKELSKSYE